MCIAIITTEHPQYPLILLNNRDVLGYLSKLLAIFTKFQPRNIFIDPRKKQPGGLHPTNKSSAATIFTDQLMAHG
jgi:uncharacterized protein with NRDE domain